MSYRVTIDMVIARLQQMREVAKEGGETEVLLCRAPHKGYTNHPIDAILWDYQHRKRRAVVVCIMREPRKEVGNV